MRLIRKWVYKLGFRPKQGSIFYSPSFIDFDIPINMRTASGEIKPHDWSAAEERIKKILAQPPTGQLGIITALNQHEEESKIDFSLKSNAESFNDWWNYMSRGLKVRQNGDLFFCPQCGGPLDSFDWYFNCAQHGRFDISIEHYRLVIRSAEKGA